MKNVYLTCAEVAQITKKSLKTVWIWCRTGKLKASRPGGREYLIKESDLEAFLNGEDGEERKA